MKRITYSINVLENVSQPRLQSTAMKTNTLDAAMVNVKLSATRRWTLFVNCRHFIADTFACAGRDS